MKSKMSFGKCLNYLLTTLDISMSRLSKVINVDSSLINRWVHGKRIPPYGTSYIDKISEFLTKNIYNSYQLEMLNELFIDIYEEKIIFENAEKKIRELLLEAQGYSMEKRKKEKSIQRFYYTKQNQNYKLHSKHFVKLGKSDISNSNINSLSNCVHLSHDDILIYGVDKVNSTGLSLIEAAASEKSTKENSIYITFDTLDFTTIPNHTLISWIQGLLKAIENGWQINFLMKLDNNLCAVLIFIQYLLPLLKTKKVNIYSFNKYDIFSYQRLIFVVSGIGAMSCFPSSTDSNIDRCFYMKNKAAIDAIKDYINVLIKTQSHSILNYYSYDKNDEYFNMLCKAMEKSGDQLYYNCNFNILLIPEDLYKKLLLRKKLKDDVIMNSLLYYRKQLTSLIINLQNNELKEICFTESMDNLVHHHYLYLNTYYGIELVELEPKEIIALIQNIINILIKYDNYKLAVIHSTNDYFDNIKEYNFKIKERQGVFFYIIKSSEYDSDIRLSINEPTIVNAFAEYFNDLWSRISSINKDKKDIIAWLQSYLYVLNKKINFD